MIIYMIILISTTTSCDLHSVASMRAVQNMVFSPDEKNFQGGVTCGS